ncbi:SH2 domain containing 6 [Cricetulus griseus]
MFHPPCSLCHQHPFLKAQEEVEEEDKYELPPCEVQPLSLAHAQPLDSKEDSLYLDRSGPLGPSKPSPPLPQPSMARGLPTNPTRPASGYHFPKLVLRRSVTKGARPLLTDAHDCCFSLFLSGRGATARVAHDCSPGCSQCKKLAVKEEVNPGGGRRPRVGLQVEGSSLEGQLSSDQTSCVPGSSGCLVESSFQLSLLLLSAGRRLSVPSVVPALSTFAAEDGAYTVRLSSGPHSSQPFTLAVLLRGRVFNIPIRQLDGGHHYALGREGRSHEESIAVEDPRKQSPDEKLETAQQSSWEPGAVNAKGSAPRSCAAWQPVGPAGMRGSGMGRQPATHRLAQSGGVSGPWRGAWNTPCRKRHVTMTPQKSRAAGKQRAAQRPPGAERARLPPVPTPHPNTSAAQRLPGNLGSGGSGRLVESPGGSQGLGNCKFEAGVGRATWAAEHSRSPSFVITLWQITPPEL